MDNNIKLLITNTIENIIKKSSTEKKIKSIDNTHKKKIHFTPRRFRVFGGLLQSINIQFGSFIEELMRQIISTDGKYEIIKEFSGKKSNQFTLSEDNEKLIDAYITKCQTESSFNIKNEFLKLSKLLINDKNAKVNFFKHDIDLLFKNILTDVYYYLEIKYNDDHDSGKFVDINRKFIKTYAYLLKSLSIKDSDTLIPILFFFNNKKMKGNIYVPEDTNIRRGKQFFDEYLEIKYTEIEKFILDISDDKDIIEMYNELYKKIVFNEG